MKKTKLKLFGLAMSMVLTLSMLTVVTPLTASAATLPIFNDFETSASDLVGSPPLTYARSGSSQGGADGSVSGCKISREDLGGGNHAVKYAVRPYSDATDALALTCIEGLFSSVPAENGEITFSARVYLPDAPCLANASFNMRIGNGAGNKSLDYAMSLFTFYSYGGGGENHISSLWQDRTIPILRNNWNTFSVTVNFETGYLVTYFNNVKAVEWLGAVTDFVNGNNYGINKASNSLVLELFAASYSGTNPYVYVDDLTVYKKRNLTATSGGDVNIPAQIPVADKTFTVNFNNDMDVTTIIPSNITLMKGSTPIALSSSDISYTKGFENGEPANKLKIAIPDSNSSYTLTLGAGIKDVFQQSVTGASTFNFDSGDFDYLYFNDFNSSEKAAPLLLPYPTTFCQVPPTDSLSWDNNTLKMTAGDSNGGTNDRTFTTLPNLFKSSGAANGKRAFSTKVWIPAANVLEDTTVSMRITSDINSVIPNHMDLFEIRSTPGRTSDFLVLNTAVPLADPYTVRNGWNDITLVLDFVTGRGSAYINGFEALDDNIVADSALLAKLNNANNMLMFEMFGWGGNPATVRFDNLSVYEVRDLSYTSNVITQMGQPGQIYAAELYENGIVVDFNNDIANDLCIGRVQLFKSSTLQNLQQTDITFERNIVGSNGGPVTRMIVDVSGISLTSGTYTLKLFNSSGEGPVKDVFGQLPFYDAIAFDVVSMPTKVTDVSFKYGANPATALLANQTLDITATINAENTSVTAVLICALYKGSQLCDVKMSNFNIVSAGAVTSDPVVSFTLPSDTTGYTLKALVWSGMDNMQPIPFAAGVNGLLPVIP